MLKKIALPSILLLGGVALGALFWRPGGVATTDSAIENSLVLRLDAMEAALRDEREARQMLEDELYRLIDQVAAGDESGAGQVAARRADAASATLESGEPSATSRRPERRSESRAEQLTNAGFAADRADYIARRESELRMEAMQARFEATQTGEAFNFRDNALRADQTLRDELGELEYEQYLEASNRPTAVGVSSVMEFSPAAQAGLQRGDQILRYNGERVYNTFELNQLQLQAGVGNNVTIDILRDGSPMQISLPSGPLGIQAGRGRRR